MTSPITHISPEATDVRRRERPDDVVLLDCREHGELALASIDGALHIPMLEVPGRCGELNAEKTHIVFCHHGIRSMNVTAFLLARGFRCENMTGGIDSWSRTVDPGVPRY